tara:strand:- start:2408 stop:3571 length:1164 start_codon:yes stop_codon:yes gene_type:complete
MFQSTDNNLDMNEEHIYYDLKIKNVYDNRIGGENSEKPIPFVIKDETSMILKKQSDYKFAIHSFMLDISIPLFCMSIQEGIQITDINATIYSFTFSFGGIDYQEYVTYIPDKNVSLMSPLAIPKPPSENYGVQDFTTGYYFTYSYASWCDMLNTTLQSLTTKVNTATPGTISEAPYYIYRDGLFSLIFPKDFPGNGVEIFCNLTFAHIMSGFRYIRQKYDNTAFKTFKIYMEQDKNAIPYAEPNTILPTIPNYYQLKQEYDTRYRFNGVSQLVLVSDYLTVRKEYYPQQPNPNNTSQDLNYQQFNSPSLPVVASFSLMTEGGALDWLENQYYLPKFYKWIDLLGERPLDKVDIKCFFQLKRGGLVQATIPIDTQSILKLVFVKKTKK